MKRYVKAGSGGVLVFLVVAVVLFIVGGLGVTMANDVYLRLGSEHCYQDGQHFGRVFLVDSAGQFGAGSMQVIASSCAAPIEFDGGIPEGTVVVGEASEIPLDGHITGSGAFVLEDVVSVSPVLRSPFGRIYQLTYSLLFAPLVLLSCVVTGLHIGVWVMSCQSDRQAMASYRFVRLVFPTALAYAVVWVGLNNLDKGQVGDAITLFTIAPLIAYGIVALECRDVWTRWRDRSRSDSAPPDPTDATLAAAIREGAGFRSIAVIPADLTREATDSVASSSSRIKRRPPAMQGAVRPDESRITSWRLRATR